MATDPHQVLSDNPELAASIVRLYPGIREIATFVQRVEESVGYPVHSYDDLVAGFGGHEATVQAAGHPVSLAMARSRVPPYYFPIMDRNDLVAKANHVIRTAMPIRCN